jgi:hypothetical protein
MQVVRARQPNQVTAHEARWGWDFARIVANRARVIALALELGEWALQSTP